MQACIKVSLHPCWWCLQVIVSVMAAVWAVRLGSYLFYRVMKAGKDRRFDEVKTDPKTFFVYWTIQVRQGDLKIVAFHGWRFSACMRYFCAQSIYIMPCHAVHSPSKPCHAVHSRSVPCHAVHSPSKPCHAVHSPSKPHAVHSRSKPCHAAYSRSIPCHAVHSSKQATELCKCTVGLYVMA
jgi:Protein of unknown function (DUF1295)